MAKSVPGFDQFDFYAEGYHHPVLRKGDGSQPGVLIIQEMPGITRETLDLAERLHADGFAVYIPVLFGEPDSAWEPLKNFARICISKEFRVLALRERAPVADYLRELCRHMQKECGGRPVGAIGLCFTGSFVLTLMIDESVAAPVMSEPAHVEGILDHIRPATPGVPAVDFRAAKARSERDNVPVLGLRFTNDPTCPKARFDYLSDQLGERFRRIEIDSSLFNKHGIKPWAHAVLTIDYDDRPGHPTRRAYEEVVTFFRERLLAA
ncbi:MAG TPA: dienelactone hydrolase family protein [Dongiaceae bacterium]|nr:dienelactone hydrolase family protein [Dongiaceae bacterium]